MVITSKRCPSLSSLLVPLLFLTLLLLYSASYILSHSSPIQSKSKSKSQSLNCDFTNGKWVFDPQSQPPLYDATCPFHRNAWNCLKNNRSDMGSINSWRWIPNDCALPRVDPLRFLESMKGKRIGFVGDSLNENFLVSFLCILRSVDGGAAKWKRKGAWRGGYFPKFDVTVAYHRAVLLAKYTDFKLSIYVAWIR